MRPQGLPWANMRRCTPRNLCCQAARHTLGLPHLQTRRWPQRFQRPHRFQHPHLLQYPQQGRVAPHRPQRSPGWILPKEYVRPRSVNDLLAD